MSELLLNAPLWLVVLLGILGLGLLVPALRTGNAQMRAAALACFGAAALLLTLRYVVPTSQKTVERETRRLAEAVAKGDWPVVSELVKYANLYDMQGEAIVTRVKQLLSIHSVKSMEINSTESKRTDTLISVTISVTTHHESAYVESVPSTWNMDWQKRGGSWILTDIRPVRVGTWGAAEAESLVH